MQYTFNVISSVFNIRSQLPARNTESITASTAAALQPVAISTTPHHTTHPMTMPNNNNYLQDTYPFSLKEIIQDTFASFNMLHTIGSAIGIWQQANQTVIPLAQRNNHHLISQSGSVENLIVLPPPPYSLTRLGLSSVYSSAAIRYKLFIL